MGTLNLTNSFLQWIKLNNQPQSKLKRLLKLRRPSSLLRSPVPLAARTTNLRPPLKAKSKPLKVNKRLVTETATASLETRTIKVKRTNLATSWKKRRTSLALRLPPNLRQGITTRTD